MCEPITIATLALAAASAGTSVYAAKQQDDFAAQQAETDAQLRDLNARRANEAYVDNLDAEMEHLRQIDAALSEEAIKNQTDTIQAVGNAKASGQVGNLDSVSALTESFKRVEGNRFAILERQLANEVSQSDRNATGLGKQRQSSIESKQPLAIGPPQAGLALIGGALNVAGAGFKADRQNATPDAGGGSTGAISGYNYRRG